MIRTICVYPRPDADGCEVSVLHGHTNWINFRQQHGRVDVVKGAPSTSEQVLDFMDATLILSPKMIILDVPRGTLWPGQPIRFHNTLKSFINIGYRMTHASFGRGSDKRVYVVGLREEIARSRGYGVRWPRVKRKDNVRSIDTKIVEANL